MNFGIGNYFFKLPCGGKVFLKDIIFTYNEKESGL
jgi:hypothetical protein